jgi:hypothetical protein
VVETGRIIKPTVYDVEKQYTHEDLKLLQELDKYSKQEKFLQ